MERTQKMPASFGLVKWIYGNVGHLVAVAWGLLGIWLLVGALASGGPNPITERKVKRFKAIKRGYYSFLILLGLGLLAGLDFLVVGQEALVVKSNGKWHFPAFTTYKEKYIDLGFVDRKDAELQPHYRDLKRELKDKEGFVLMPLWGYGPTLDGIDALAKEVDPKSVNYDGLATRLYDVHKPSEPHIRYLYRKGIRQFEVQGWDRENERVFKGWYQDGVLQKDSIEWSGEGELEDFLNASPVQEYDVSYPPSKPKFWSNPLGTNSKGYDVVANVYGGLQVNFQAAILFIPIVYAIGITIGLLMGFFGGWFDLIVQRLIEVLSNIPFLFLVIIVTQSISAKYMEGVGLYVVVLVLAAFGWMSMTNLMRTAALKEKARDYIAASRVIGAGVPRILFKHLMPNTIAILVTLVPFSISTLILSLTALDYLGLSGLPERYATWGKLLKDGIGQLSSPWIVTTAFVCLVTFLVLITFVGEAIREAFDPKKHTYYR